MTHNHRRCSVDNLSDRTGFDEAQLRESLTAVDPDPQVAMRLLLETYVEDADGLMRQVRSAAEQLDFNGLRFAAHTLKSSSALMGIMGLSRLCQQLEQRARSQSSDALLSLVQEAETIQAESQALLLAYQPCAAG